MATERGTVYLWPTPAQPCRWRWLAPDADAPAEGELADLQRAIAPAAPRPAIALLLPAEAVLTATVAVPSRKPQHIRAAVPNLVEEWLADDLEALHIAIGERDDRGQVAVAAIAKSLLRERLNALDAAGLAPDTAAIDALRLPWRPGEIALAVDAGRALLRWSAHHAGAIDSDQLGLWLDLLLAQWPTPADRPRTLALLSAAASPAPAALAETIAQLRQRHHLELRQQPVAGDLTVWLCRNPATPPLDLLQGEFAPRADHARQWRRWRPVAYAAAAVVALQLSFNFGAGLWLNHRADHWRGQSTALYRDLFPADRRLVNLRQQLLNHLDRADTGAASPFLALFGQLAGAIQATAGEPPLQLRSLTFEAGSGQLVVELIAPSVAVMDALQKRLQGQGVGATILSATNESERVIGRLRVGGNPS